MADRRPGREPSGGHRHRARVLAAAAAAAALALGGCSAAEVGASPGESARHEQARVVLKPAGAAPQLIAGTDAEAAFAASRALFESSPLAVLAPPEDPAAVKQAVTEAVRLGVPLLLAADGLMAELERLGVRSAKVFGTPEPSTTAAAPGASPGASGGAAQGQRSDGTSRPAASSAAPEAGWSALLPGIGLLGPDDPASRPAGAGGTAPGSVLLAPEAEEELPAAVAVARAAGARVQQDPAADPREDPKTIDFLRAAPDNNVIGLGAAFGDAEMFAARTEAALTAPELPGGGLLAFPSRRMVALYGHPSGAALGALGEQDVQASIERAKELAKQYQPYSDQPVQPAFEIIATVATDAAGADGDYSAESDVSELRRWVDAAGEAGVYVVLDLQPGTTDFLTQAKRYEELLKLPHVGLALDPEWRLQPGQRHMEQIGSVPAAEINEVSAWLAGLIRRNNLPQKVLILHQFQPRMISNREDLDMSHEELAVVVHADGHGTPEQKMDTWRTLRQDLPQGTWMGWKNFYDEDMPAFTPERTYRGVSPAPWFVSYQ
ncbi:hypothetical protein [Arthrobacter mangrovi]|uniref:Lipoprotein n=1 Tax=Arthrobacter mangrovi TaxID=2966350 RepID=A0ABQ5MQR2_9MICC|nr:hypothetical protein [Arthrobacter mangrovi]GLB66293.1 hypothetical protein AHIS1636_07320 [Arthrobacter mangrovi]